MKTTLVNLALGAFMTGSIDVGLTSDTIQSTTNTIIDHSTVISIIGGVISTVLINILKSKFPDLFKKYGSKKKKKSSSVVD